MASVTNAVRGLRLILVGLLMALLLSIANIAITVAFLTSPNFGLDLTSRAVIGFAFGTISIAATVVAGFALRPLNAWRAESGSGRRLGLRAIFLVAISAGAGAGILFGTGIFLGMIRLEGDAFLLVHSAHLASEFLFAVTAGLFLFLLLRELGPLDANMLAGAALALGILSAIVSVLRSDLGLAPYVLSLGSLALWVLGFAGTIVYLRRRTSKGGQPASLA